MSTKQELSQLYPQANDMPNAPPDYNNATAPPSAPYNQPAGYGAPIMSQPGPPQATPQQVFIMQGAPPQAPFGPRPSIATCHACQKQGVTRIELVNGSKTHIAALICCILTGCCCCIPYCMDSCKVVNHHCSSCGSYLGAYNQ